MTAALLAVALVGCGVYGGRPPGGPHPETAMLSMLASWSVAPGDTVVIAGFREPDGATSPETEALDEILLSAASRSGLVVRPDAGVAGAGSPSDLKWVADSALPAGWRELPAAAVAAGQVRTASPWVYLRLLVADTRTGEVRLNLRQRIAERDLSRLVAARQRRRTGAGARPPEELEIELHVVVRRDEGGFPRRIDLQEEGSLDQDDRLQLRFRTAQDCEVFAFLYRSDGSVQSLVEGGAVYAGRWIYAPGENSWESLTAGDEVYTLYFLAAPRIEEDHSSLWEELTDLQDQGQIERFRGLDLVDAAVVRLLQRTTVDADSVSVIRGADGIELGETERLIYADGTSFDNSPEQLRGAVIARAYSVEVQYR